VEDGCACERASTQNPGALVGILQEDGIPVVEVKRRGEQRLKLRYVRAFPERDYTTISHLWSDGLGDHGRNDLPYCQIQRIVAHIRHLDESWTSSLPISVSRRPVYSRLDVYCVPLESHPGLKQTAIARMVPTYAFARETLILSREIERTATAAMDPAEFLARMTVSGWYGRY
jgi:hypothetical protein